MLEYCIFMIVLQINIFLDKNLLIILYFSTIQKLWCSSEDLLRRFHDNSGIIFLYFSIKTYVVGTH